jgi:polysaccharide pyruvyl transferase WcaK-like protein
MKKVLLYGWYNSSNLGDDAILLIVYDYLRSKNIDCDIISSDNGKNYFNIRDKYNFSYIKDPLSITKVIKNKYLRRILKLYNFVHIILVKDKNVLEDYDSIIFIGGGYVNDIWIRELIRIFFIITLAKISNKKVIFTGQTIGPFDKFISKSLAKKFLKKSDLILVREKFSLKLLNELKLKNVKISSDDIYLYNKEISNNSGDYIIINLKEFPGYDINIMDKFIKLLVLINKKLNYKLVFIPFGINDGPKDLKYINMYMKKLKEHNILSELYITDNLDNLFNEFANARLTLGMAYHSVTISLFTNTPAYSIYRGDYYKNKILGVLSHYELESNALNFENIDDGKLVSFANYIISTHNNEEYLTNIKNKTENLKKLCNKNWESIINKI